MRPTLFLAQAAQAAKTAAETAKAPIRTFRELHGVVISAGLMDKTVKVRVGGQKWNNWVKKFFDDPKTHLVHDPSNSLRLGDVVAITPGFRTSKSKRHVVKHIIAPGSGVPINMRPRIPNAEELHAERAEDRKRKLRARELAHAFGRADNKIAEAALVGRQVEKELSLRKRLMELARKDEVVKKVEEPGKEKAQ